ncbi:MAG: hypothetical protein WCQ50_03340 [Spirochaetota bacterium]
METRALLSRIGAIAFFVALAFALFAPVQASGEVLSNKSGCYLDLPEGFDYSDGDQQSRFSFADPNQGMEFDFFVYAPGRFKDRTALMSHIEGGLRSSGEKEGFIYEGREAAMMELDFSQDGALRKGWAIVVAGKPAKGQTPAEASFALLAWTDPDTVESYSDLMFSCLDGFSIDRAALRAPGPVSQYLLPFPAARKETRKVKFGQTTLDVAFSKDEATRVEETAAREFRVLESYAKHETLWKDAWARCYRLIFREASRRMDQFVSQIDPLLPADPTSVARSLLAWVQDWKYERDPNGIDFIDPITAAVEGRGDCDSRAMVMTLILERRGIPSILMLSKEYSHAMAAVDVPGGGQRFTFADKDWLVAETTAHVGIGLVAANQADWKKWLGVQLGY